MALFLGCSDDGYISNRSENMLKGPLNGQLNVSGAAGRNADGALWFYSLNTKASRASAEIKRTKVQRQEADTHTH